MTYSLKKLSYLLLVFSFFSASTALAAQYTGTVTGPDENGVYTLNQDVGPNKTFSNFDPESVKDELDKAIKAGGGSAHCTVNGSLDGFPPSLTVNSVDCDTPSREELIEALAELLQ